MRIPDGRQYLYRELIAPPQERDNSMQQATTLRTNARAAAVQWTIAAIVTLAMLVMAGAAALSPRVPYATRNVSAPVRTTHNRTFGNEAGYVPSVSEYVSLGETYIPVTDEHTVYQPIFRSRLQADQQAAIPSAAEYADGIWSEDYRVTSVKSIPARVEAGNFASRTFADEAHASVLVQAYSGLIVDENYLPLADRMAPATPVQAPGSRAFADQGLDVVSAAEYAALPLGVDYSLASTPR